MSTGIVLFHVYPHTVQYDPEMVLKASPSVPQSLTVLSMLSTIVNKVCWIGYSGLTLFFPHGVSWHPLYNF